MLSPSGASPGYYPYASMRSGDCSHHPPQAGANSTNNKMGDGVSKPKIPGKPKTRLRGKKRKKQRQRRQSPVEESQTARGKIYSADKQLIRGAMPPKSPGGKKIPGLSNKKSLPQNAMEEFEKLEKFFVSEQTGGTPRKQSGAYPSYTKYSPVSSDLPESLKESIQARDDSICFTMTEENIKMLHLHSLPISIVGSRTANPTALCYRKNDLRRLGIVL